MTSLVDVSQADRDCLLLDEFGFQVGAIARVTGEYADDWPDPVRILGIERYRTGALNITIGDLDDQCLTDGFSIEEITPEPRRHRLTAEQAKDADRDHYAGLYAERCGQVAELTALLREARGHMHRCIPAMGNSYDDVEAYRDFLNNLDTILNKREGDNATG